METNEEYFKEQIFLIYTVHCIKSGSSSQTQLYYYYYVAVWWKVANNYMFRP